MSRSPSGTARRSDPPKTLTPQRKHRKLLKDGSGTEVWPESIEKVFVQGLEQYWKSPWATYSQARGRSRWRNQFLVDYLQKAGISRSKKQVASHIQVLRNMWKGEPEFHLVAGGDEPSLEPGHLPVKLEERGDATSLFPMMDYEDMDTPSPVSASPNYSPGEYALEFPPSPAQPLSPLFGQHSPTSANGSFPVESRGMTPPTTSLAYPSSRTALSNFVEAVPRPGTSNPSPLRRQEYPEPHLTGRHTSSRLRSDSSGVYFPPPGAPISPGSTTDVGFVSSYSRPSQSKITALCLLADGMTPFSIKLDALLSSAPTTTRPIPIALKVRLSISPPDDMRSPAALQGFIGSVCLSNVWAQGGKCMTKVYTGNACVSEEMGTLDVTSLEAGGAVVALLPQSALSKCRWLEPSIQATITQEILVDNETLLYIIYDLDRRNGSSLPSAELLGYQKYRAPERSVPSTYQHRALQPLPAVNNTTYPSYAPNTPCARISTQTSLACALTPTTTNRHATTASMSF